MHDRRASPVMAPGKDIPSPRVDHRTDSYIDAYVSQEWGIQGRARHLSHPPAS